MRAPIQMVTGELPWPSESEDAFRAAVIAGSKGMSTDLLERAGMDEVLHQTIVNLLHPNPLHRCASHPHPQRHPPLCVPPSPTADAPHGGITSTGLALYRLRTTATLAF